MFYRIKANLCSLSLTIAILLLLAGTSLAQIDIFARSANKVIHVEGAAYPTPEAAIAAAPASPQGFQIYHDRIATTSVGFSLGNTACPNYLGADMFLDPGAQITLNTLNGSVKLICNARLQGADGLSSVFLSGSNFTTGPMLDMGDNLAADNNSLFFTRWNCSALTAGPCIRARGQNDISEFWGNVVQNNNNGVSWLIDGTTQASGNHFYGNNFINNSGASAGDFFQVNTSVGDILFFRSTTVSSAASAIPGAGIHITGTGGLTGAPIIDMAHHSEKVTDGLLIDNNQMLIGIGVDVGAVSTNGVHIGAAATGSAYIIGAHNNQGNSANPTVLNSVTGTSIGSNNAGTNPTAFGMVPHYEWYHGIVAGPSDAEDWLDGNGWHWNGAISSFKINTANNDPIEVCDTGSTPRCVHIGFNQALANTFGIRSTSGDSTAHQLVNFPTAVGGGIEMPGSSSGTSQLQPPASGGVLNTLPTTAGTLAVALSATSTAFATATTAGTCVNNTTAVANATTSMAVVVSPASTPGVGAVWSAFVSSAGNVTINECAVATSAGGTIAFNIRVIP